MINNTIYTYAKSVWLLMKQNAHYHENLGVYNISLSFSMMPEVYNALDREFSDESPR